MYKSLFLIAFLLLIVGCDSTLELPQIQDQQEKQYAPRTTPIYYREVDDVVRPSRNLPDESLIKELLEQIYYGKTYYAVEWHWVTVLNLEPIIRWSWSFSYGDSCLVGSIDPSNMSPNWTSTVQVRGKAKGKVLYEYTAPWMTTGNRCPTGVIFFDVDIAQ